VDIFVTDYSPHPHVGDFFSAELADRVIKIEMNDTAADLQEEMKVGDYWFLKNTRIKIGFESGLMEGRLRESDGVRKLDPNDLLNEPHFEALLRYGLRLLLHLFPGGRANCPRLSDGRKSGK
jgi:hypothetical protein